MVKRIQVLLGLIAQNLLRFTAAKRLPGPPLGAPASQTAAAGSRHESDRRGLIHAPDRGPDRGPASDGCLLAAGAESDVGRLTLRLGIRRWPADPLSQTAASSRSEPESVRRQPAYAPSQTAAFLRS